MGPTRVILVGAGGYGQWYTDVLLAEAEARGVVLAGVVDPFLDGCRQLPELRARGVPLFYHPEDFFSAGHCDLALIVSPIHLHARQTCLALAQGSHVLCEKPLCATAADIERMRAAEEASGLTVTVGYQWSFSPAVQRLKADVLLGRFGRPRRLRTLAAWPRDEAYFQRNRWAGRQRTEAGEPILDSPVNNATAHFLHNMLYVVGPEVAASADPLTVEAELWRANRIENYDTAALRILVEGGAELLFYTSHAVEEPTLKFCYEFEHAVVAYESKQGQMTATLAGGEIIYYGSPEEDRGRKIWKAVESARSGQRPVCGVASAAAHVRCVLQAQASPAGIRDFPPDILRVDRRGPVPLHYAEGLAGMLERCYAAGELFGEAGGLDSM